MDNITETGEQTTSKLATIGYSKDDPRTPEQKEKGTPWFSNEGLLSIELDTDAVVDLLITEGLSPQQISDLKVTFAARRFPNTDLSGAPIGGLHKGNEVVVFTSAPVIAHSEETPPALVKDRFVTFHSAHPAGEVVDTTLHELKHFVQSKIGTDMPNSWAAETMQAHDNLPTEREAIEFARDRTLEFRDKIKVSDRQGIFKRAEEIVPILSSRGETYVTGLVNEEMVAKLYDDSPESNDAYEYISRFENLISGQGFDSSLVAQFIDTGQELVSKGFISEYELGYMLDRIKDMFNNRQTGHSGY